MSAPEGHEVPAAEAVAPPATPPALGLESPAPKPRKKGVLRWLLLTEQLLQARANAARFTLEQREYLRRAKLSFELGELALAPGNAVRSGSTAPLAANLFRQSLYWALLSQSPERRPVSPEEMWAAADSSLLAALGASDAELTQISAAMRSTFIELAEGSPETQLGRAHLLRRVATRAVTTAQRPLWQLEWSKLKRLVRVVAVLVVLAGLAGFGLVVLLTKPDLAKGKPWRVSSIGIECHPEKSDCGGTTTDILFHTKNEMNPWFEYDFGAPLAFSSLTIRNRTDCCGERVAPLIVEVSNDDKTFHEVIRRTDTFTTWKPSFPTQHARYLRLRIARESMLHLEAIKVHP